MPTRKLVADQMGVGRTQIQNAVKRKREIMEEYEANENCEKKRPRRATEYDDINDLTHKWFLEATSRKSQCFRSVTTAESFEIRQRFEARQLEDSYLTMLIGCSEYTFV